MSNATGRFRVVVECRSALRLTGNVVWLYRLECGAAGERVKRKRYDRKQHPAPIRVRCKCPKCV